MTVIFASIRPCNENIFTQNLMRMFHHTATECLDGLHGAETSWTLNLSLASNKFCFVSLSIRLKGKIFGSPFFSDFFCMKLDIVS